MEESFNGPMMTGVFLIKKKTQILTINNVI